MDSSQQVIEQIDTGDFTAIERGQLRTMLSAYQNGKRFDQLETAKGAFDKMYVAVRDESGETRKLNLHDALDSAGNPIAGRYWLVSNTSPLADGYYGSLEALKALPNKLGLGRYLVTDDRVRRKLDPKNSKKFEDGSTALLDGTMGQCMFCWNAHYYTEWIEDGMLIKAISFAPITGKKSQYVPAGGCSWFSSGVIDRTTTTLCSVISDDSRYRGGGNAALSTTTYPQLPVGSPQQTMLGMPATSTQVRNFSTYARKRGEGWESAWFVSRAVVEYLTQIIMGTKSIQQGWSESKDSNGLYRCGFGSGVTNLANTAWVEYSNYNPLFPTSLGLEMADNVGMFEYPVYKADGTLLHTFKIGNFFGLVGATDGLYWWGIRGLVIDMNNDSAAYVAPSMYAGYDDTKTDGLLRAAQLPRSSGYIKSVSYNLFCGVPTEIGATASTYYGDYLWTDPVTYPGLRVRLAAGRPDYGTNTGAVACNTYYAATYSHQTVSAPLCYFEEDPVVIP